MATAQELEVARQELNLLKEQVAALRKEREGEERLREQAASKVQQWSPVGKVKQEGSPGSSVEQGYWTPVKKEPGSSGKKQMRLGSFFSGSSKEELEDSPTKGEPGLQDQQRWSGRRQAP